MKTYRILEGKKKKKKDLQIRARLQGTRNFNMFLLFIALSNWGFFKTIHGNVFSASFPTAEKLFFKIL